MNGDFVIIGDTERHKDCLVRVIGKEEQKAYEVLNKIAHKFMKELKLRLAKKDITLKVEDSVLDPDTIYYKG